MTRTAAVAIAKKVAVRLAQNKVGGAALSKKQVDRFRQAKRAHAKRQLAKVAAHA